MLAGVGRARADGLSADERARLARGEVVKREVTLDLDHGHYVGGVSYAIIQAAPESVIAALGDVAAYRSILPLTLEARQVDRRGAETWIALRHGGKLGSAAYTMRVRKESRTLIRFWLDPQRPHDVDDAWGYFRVQPFGDGATLLTYGAVVNLGFGITRLLFETRVRDLALNTPALVRRYVEDRRGPVRVAQGRARTTSVRR